MITKTYVVKMSAEGDALASKDFVSSEIERITFVRPVKVACIDRDVPDSRFMREDLYSKEELEKALIRGKKEGREEAWALARKIGGSTLTGNYTPRILGEIFGTASIMTILENDYETVKKRVSDYENMPKVGDIVVLRDSNPVRGVVTNIEKDSEFCYAILFEDGLHGSFNFDDLEKTGEHIDLKDIFKKLKGEE